MITTRSNSLAFVFQEALTAIVRVRFRLQTVADADIFRRQMRQLLQAPMQEARNLGYDNQKIQGCVFAVVALLDESVLNLQDPVFAQWARRPLQEELFGGHLAGETFFQNLRSYLSEQDSQQLADVLELHCICLHLGYRGRYALGDSGELYDMLRQARARIQRIRGDARIGAGVIVLQANQAGGRADTLTRSLWWATGALAFVLLIAFCVYSILLTSGAAALHSAVAGAM
ncbi:type VI secretion system protein ImpK [Granulicella aggregans]|uniref:Type VI secretion system protein ImpK n=1 Tax=Granulicella aggregans TaxID=474949 RepID=A0A7W7ZI49_9BACT|nr:DotU family type IV/VI secretion system protein [Granulicella aggregans]MBB5060369.1 type VI secretion system protein ImpK [Granulicella aggregans]